MNRRAVSATSLTLSILTVFILFISMYSTTLQARTPSGAASLTMGSSTSATCNGCGSLPMTVNANQSSLLIVQISLTAQSYIRGTNAPYHSAYLASLTSPGLTFRDVFSYTTDPHSGDGSLVWVRYAIVPAAGTYTVTATMNNSLAAFAMVAFSVNGENMSRRFDPNSGWEFNDCNQHDGCQLAFSTTSPNTMVVAGIASQGYPIFIAPVNGFKLIGQSGDNGWGTGALAYRSFSSTQNSVSTGNWGMTGPSIQCTQTPTNSCGESALWYYIVITLGSTSSSSTVMTSNTKTSTTAATSLVTGICTVTFTMSNGTVKGYQASC